ncbi:MAG TPA: hypothetical protein VMZ52_12595 [Bryobacteraceae bacterium]|nr:hypothetical protein [Bryobacteraceae bacterium]
MRPKKSTCARLLKIREDLTESERHDLSEVLARWAHSEEHARRIVLALPERPGAIDIREAASRIPVATATRRPSPGCSRCYGSGFAVTIGAGGYTGAQPCRCVTAQPELLLASR